ncbi:hypothetical protein [Kitasatospora viridis]|uniref:Heparin binding hemagglutinin HbhA n=1 Tax=Kitasatospora viridis TaxID=281105 RepID=A0A561UIN1_9ACTN|nr:hypothetical protein [Kitasatospora viridis]TWF99215.1 hypothetical protein FHX73_113056 [Kitasatospora viridis]
MPSTEEIRNEIRKTLSDPTPLYALAGVGDLAYEKLREVPGRVEALAADRKAAQAAAVARLHEAQERLVGAQAKVADSVGTLPTDLKSLQEKAQGFALQQAGRAAGLAVRAKEVYDELAERGRTAVSRPGGATGESVTVERAEVVTLDTEGAGKRSDAAAEPVEPELAEAEVVEPEPERPTAKRAPRSRRNPGAEQPGTQE